MLPLEIEEQDLWWVLGEFQRVQRQRFDDQMLAVQATELGVARALAAAFGAKDMGPLPEWGEVKGKQKKGEKTPEWWIKYAEANPGRVRL